MRWFRATPPQNGSTFSITTGRPTRLAIDPDDYHAAHVGLFDGGKQFFLTTPFVPALDGPGCEYVALYTFSVDGQFLQAKIDGLGPRADLDRAAAKRIHDQRLSELGAIQIQRIEVEPFSIEEDGVVFGLIVREPEDPDDEWAVEVQPGDYMAFFEPWDGGVYDT